MDTILILDESFILYEKDPAASHPVHYDDLLSMSKRLDKIKFRSSEAMAK